MFLLLIHAELIESTMYLYQATKDPYYLEIGRDILESIERHTKTSCGYATVSTAHFVLFKLLSIRQRDKAPCIPFDAIHSIQIIYVNVYDSEQNSNP